MMRTDTSRLSCEVMATEACPDVMQAVRYYAPGDVRVETVSVPQPGLGELLLKIDVALTDGTDLKAYRRGHPVLLGETYPAPFGHECVGRVVAIGKGVETNWLGKRVVPANSAPCGSCYSCQRTQPSQCASLKLLNGAYADYLVLPERIVQTNLYPVSDDIEPLQVAFAEPLAVCLKGIAETRISPGDSLAVYGTGPVATILAMLAKQAGAHVTVLGRSLDKLAMIKARSGAHETLCVPLSCSEIHAKTPSQKGFDVVIEATGQPECWDEALDWVRPGGTLHLFGGCPRGSTVTWTTERIHYDEIRIVSSFHHTPEYFQDAVRRLATGTIDLRFLMTHAFSLADAPEAFRLMDEGRAQKVALYPQGLPE
jgi:L-iditol 2-dehydrogenase